MLSFLNWTNDILSFLIWKLRCETFVMNLKITWASLGMGVPCPCHEMHLWHDSRAVEWCSATSLLLYMNVHYGDWVIFRGVWMHPRSVSVKVMIWYVLVTGLCVHCTPSLLGASYSNLMRTPLISDYLRGLPSICDYLWNDMILFWAHGNLVNSEIL